MREVMDLEVFATVEEAGARVADLAAQQVENFPRSVLGLATGSTPIPIYEGIVRHMRAGRITLAQVTTFNLDEYVGLGPEDPHSFAFYMRQHLFGPLAMAPAQTFMPPNQGPDLKTRAPSYDRLIEGRGGIDWQLLGIGRNGHIGFNEPGTPFDSETHIAALSDSTRRANAPWFDNDWDRVPRQAVTMGLATIMRSRAIVMAAFGEDKADALAQAFRGPLTPEVPASVLRSHPSVVVIADRAAARLLAPSRGAYPV